MRRSICPAAIIALTVLVGGGILADDPSRQCDEFNEKVNAALTGHGSPATVRFPIGRTRRGTLIWCLADRDALDLKTSKQRILVVGGLDGSSSSIEATLEMLDGRNRDPKKTYAYIPIANPDGWASESRSENLSGGRPDRGYPPEGTAYNSPTDPESQFLWRFIGWFAPDVVWEMHDDSAPEWQRYAAGQVRAEDAWPKDCLAHAVSHSPVAGIATATAVRWPTSARISGLELSTTAEMDTKTLDAYLYGGRQPFRSEERSPLRKAVLRRLDRTPLEVAEQLADHYGDHLETVMYQPALALVARLRLSELTGDETHREGVERVVSRYVDGTDRTLDDRVSGSHLAGHLIFAELARITGREESVQLIRKAADFGFHEDGGIRESMPFHNEMSDAVFMACPILTSAARHTGKDRYFEMADRHLRFMQQTCLRSDGIYRHSPLCEAAWGRGNGFPALGLALSLAELEAVSDDSVIVRELYAFMLSSLTEHLRALAKHQDVNGMWQQVIDDPGSYRELTSTCMITYAMVRGIRSGWLDEAEFGAAANRAWEAIKVRVGEDGILFDVCTGTGKQQSLQDYRDRTAILGRDERGGAMALIAAVEVAAWRAEQKTQEAQ